MPISFADALRLMKHEYRHSSTARWFETPLKQFLTVAGYSYECPVHKVIKHDADVWYEWLVKRPLVDETKDNYIRALQTFYSKLIELQHVSHNPFAHLERPRLLPKPPKDIEDDYIDLLVRYSQGDLRTHAMILILRDTGARIGGVLSMDVDKTFIEQGDGRYRGRALMLEKGDHQRGRKAQMKFFKHEAATAVKRYLETRPVYWDHVAALWVSGRGQRLSYQAAYHAIKKTAAAAGVDERFNPHAFRHRKVKELTENGAPPKVIAELMGWTSVKMLDRYVKFRDNELERLFDEYSNS